jgi:glycosyltransferase involved in cell wall biosynthesis
VTLITPETAPDMSNGHDFPRIRQRSLERGWEQVVVPALGDNLMERVLSFRRHANAWWRKRRATVIHFRSIFEGYPLARGRESRCEKLVYEVNGLPSIELKYHYPSVADDAELLKKLQAQELFCLDAADLIVTVSQTNAALLRKLGVDSRKIRVIPNGVDPRIFTYQPPRPWNGRPIQLLYSGTFSLWQGVDLAIEALALLRRDHPAKLVLVGSAVARQMRSIVETCRRWEVTDHVEILPATTQAGLATLHHAADVILAPLRATERNTSQGCCPLKVLEAMASGTPLIASDLPVVRELAEPDRDAQLVRAGSAKAIKDALHPS